MDSSYKKQTSTDSFIIPYSNLEFLPFSIRNNYDHFIRQQICKKITALRTIDVIATSTDITYGFQRQKSRSQEIRYKAVMMDTVMPDSVKLSHIYRMYSDRRPASDYYFCNKSGGGISTAYFRQRLSEVSAVIGAQVNAHAWRHTCGTRIATRVGPAQASNILDHASINTTQLYISRQTQDTRSIISQSLGR